MRVTLRVSARPSPLLDAKSGWVDPGRFTNALPCFEQEVGLVARSSRIQMPPSRQERRKAERDAAKRAPQAGATGAAGAAAALANLNANPLGDWTTQADDFAALFGALGAENVKRKADEGDREAQFSQGYRLMCEADGAVGAPLGTAGRSPKADVGFARCTAQFPVAYQTEMRGNCY